MKKILTVSLFACLASGCAATNKDIYYWGDYSHSAYEYQSEPSEVSLAKHRNSLLEIIAKAPVSKKRVPPGIYAELAQLEIKQSNWENAKKYLQQEQMLFPESSVLVQTMLKMISSKETASVEAN
ncbi:DUF4810 domain-containing protein [Bowmanella sp. JS7-9]|uniref:DUF4810 domain-containing protein n=1 Tax=Pseudobowmanella zhangzhouensis TaxID=1537679 RepID=A0ABW1XQ89_9ALTE|nr:DUF4810 domain-containing protein [Bowmanella sp. JS7-9]TBX20402.1 hypothetical protein TK45_15600 [Bowmanella sp. JS7-9]